ncbi:diguanylate cyclase (plasmid) [Enterobacter soli]|uniref:GGDEF domain-containing protein n=1 Tax=Enterobacter soli TaxID=885040 RepID=UPI000223CEC0|nr:GGDEF domain-containing protein [Enterobacter soli]AEN67184.1 diguanylate cyclase [Enterobacter soli]OAT35097.1 GGDEF domain protein [Enterobacter soli ATCC BAA-2102]
MKTKRHNKLEAKGFFISYVIFYTSLFFFVGYLSSPGDFFSLFWPVNSVIVYIICKHYRFCILLPITAFYITLSLLDSIFSRGAVSNPWILNISNAFFVIICSFLLRKRKFDNASELDVIYIYVSITISSLLFGLSAGLLVGPQDKFISTFSGWGAESLSTGIIILPTMLLWEINAEKLTRKIKTPPAIFMIFMLTVITYFDDGINITLILPALLLCAVIYPLRLSLVITSITGLFLIYMVSSGVIKMNSFGNLNGTFSGLDSYRIAISSIIGAATLCAVSASKNQRIKKEISEQLLIDELTGVYNRRYLLNKLNNKINPKKGNFLSLAVIDVDNFKEVNDVYGHLAGDKIIKLLAILIKSNFGGDIFCRYGGDEFIVIHENNDTKFVKEHFSNLNVLFDRCIKTYNINANIGISIGISFQDADIALDVDNIKTLISRADEALYKAKKNGKRQTVLA